MTFRYFAWPQPTHRAGSYHLAIQSDVRADDAGTERDATGTPHRDAAAVQQGKRRPQCETTRAWLLPSAAAIRLGACQVSALCRAIERLTKWIKHESVSLKR